MVKIRFKRIYIGFILCCIGIFVFPYILRNRFIPNIASVNILFSLGLFMMFNSKLVLFPLNRKDTLIHKYIYIIFLVLSSFLLFYVQGNGWSIILKAKMLFVYILPATLIFMVANDPHDSRTIVEGWYKCIEFICYGMIVAWVFDKVAGGILQKFWIYLYQSSSLISMYNSKRFISFYGHSLLNANFMLLLLLWTLVRQKENVSSKNYIINIFVTFFGIAITGSKSGLLMAVLMIFAFATELKNFKYVFPIFVGFILLYFSGAFDLVLSRLVTGVQAGDLTTTRNTSLFLLIERGVIELDLFKGHLFDYTGTSMIAALEYPFLRWSFRNGIVFAVIIYIVYFLYPIVSVCIMRKWRVLVGILAYMAYVNGYDGISGFGDTLIIYSMNIGFILLLCRISSSSS